MLSWAPRCMWTGQHPGTKAGFPCGFLKIKKRTSYASSLALIMHPATFPRLIKYVLVLNVPGLNPSGGHSSCDPFVHCVPLLSIVKIYLFSYLGVDLSLPHSVSPLSLHGFSLYFVPCIFLIWAVLDPDLLSASDTLLSLSCCSSWCSHTQAFHSLPIHTALNTGIR